MNIVLMRYLEFYRLQNLSATQPIFTYPSVSGKCYSLHIPKTLVNILCRSISRKSFVPCFHNSVKIIECCLVFQYMGSFSVAGPDQASRAEYMRRQLLEMRVSEQVLYSESHRRC